MAIAGLVLLLVLVFGKKKPLRVEGILIPTFRNILEREVEFYRKLNADQKKQFETERNFSFEKQVSSQNYFFPQEC